MANLSLACEETLTFDSVPELLADIAAGKMVVLLDDEDRENEGDLVMAAKFVTAEAINFMATFGRGLICMPVSVERARQLQLRKMVQNNASPYSTNFTVSIEAAADVSTGISAADRAQTIHAAAAVAATHQDIISPGHVFPLIAESGGVLVRPGHTEAVIDLCRLAECGDAGVLVEILNEDGSMARRDDCLRFARQHGLKIGTIADLIAHRREHTDLGLNAATSLVRETKRDFMNQPTIHRGDFHAVKPYRIAIVSSQFNQRVVQHLEQGAVELLRRYGIEADAIDIFHVPGAFELPLAVKQCAKSNRFDGVIALGAVIKGETPHFDYVAGAATNGLASLALEYDLPISFGVLTTDTEDQAMARAGGKAGNKGEDCAQVVLEMLSLIHKMEG